MAFFRKLFGKGEKSKPSEPEYELIPAADNPWNVDLIDVRPHTLQAISLTTSEQYARNSLSFGPTEDGLEFSTQEPENSSEFEVCLVYNCAENLPDGPIYLPQSMEEKWALFLFEKRVIVVSSWERAVKLVAQVEHCDNVLRVCSGKGCLVGESPERTGSFLDFLIRSHALAELTPLPAPTWLRAQRHDLAQWCFGAFGKRVHYACFGEPKLERPARPIRTHSALHTACARGDLDTVKRLVGDGMSPDLLGGDQLSPIHWVLAGRGSMLEGVRCLLDLGASVAGADPDGFTVLMAAANQNAIEVVELLLARGASPNDSTADRFTALHMAAERGRIEILRLLLKAGGDPQVESDGGHTPLSLARMRDETEIVELLENRLH